MNETLWEELEVSEGGEADLHRHYNSCKKNPGHTGFVPFHRFNIDHLPEDYRDDDVVDLIKATGNLTFKRTRASNLWGEVRISTARHVVFDGPKARQATCRLFYDRQDSPLVILDGWSVVRENVGEDWCELKCVTCDLDLLNKLEKMRRHWHDLWRRVNRKYMGRCDEAKLTFIVSHPHGCPKQVSVGHSIERFKVGRHRTKYTYTTCTCPGSSGAYVNPLGYNGCVDDLHVHSGVNSNGSNICTVGYEYDF